MLDFINETLAARVMADEFLAVFAVRDRANTENPDDPLRPFGKRHHRPGKAVAIAKIVVGQPVADVARGNRRGRPGHPEQTQGIAHLVGVPPEPVNLVAINGRLDRILPGHPPRVFRFGQRERLAEQQCVTPQSLAGEAGEAMGDDRSLERNLDGLSRPGRDANADYAERVGRRLVAVPVDGEEYFPIQQSRFEKGDPSRVVGDESLIVDRGQFHQGDAAFGLGVDHADLGDFRTGAGCRGGTTAAPKQGQGERNGGERAFFHRGGFRVPESVFRIDRSFFASLTCRWDGRFPQC